jgi:PAS domain S-box-containing protein
MSRATALAHRAHVDSTLSQLSRCSTTLGNKSAKLTLVGNTQETRVDPSALFRAIVQSADDAITSIDLNETITSWNRAAERLYGYEAKEVLGKSNRLIIPPDRNPEEDEVVKRIKSGEGVQHFDTIRVRKDGSRIEVAITASAIHGDGIIIGVSKIARDISERKHAERNGARLAAIVESSNDAIVGKDLNGIITSWNPAAERMFGYTAGEAIGQSIRLIIPEGHQHEEDTILDRIRRDESIQHFETIRCRKDGVCLPISVTVSPIRDPAGIIIGASKIARDISEQKRAEALAQRAHREAEFVARAAEKLSGSLDYEARLKGLVELAVPRWPIGRPSTPSSPTVASGGSLSRMQPQARPTSVPRPDGDTTIRSPPAMRGR